jgi:segregation and condensation protein A
VSVREPQPEPDATVPRQEELPLAIVLGERITELPADLYIPPDALEVVLETFEGPLDLLLYLIRRRNLDILLVDVAEITRQYVEYIAMMEALRFELAAEYLVMAAMLAEIKSRMLLPRQPQVEDEDDPRAELIRRLQEYERFKEVAVALDALPRLERDIFPAELPAPECTPQRPLPPVELRELLMALVGVMERARLQEHHHIRFEPLSTRARMADVLDRLCAERFVPFVALFKVEEGRRGVVVTFLAIMELVKETLIEIVQAEPYGPIHVTARAADGERH